MTATNHIQANLRKGLLFLLLLLAFAFLQAVATPWTSDSSGLTGRFLWKVAGTILLLALVAFTEMRLLPTSARSSFGKLLFLRLSIYGTLAAVFSFIYYLLFSNGGTGAFQWYYLVTDLTLVGGLLFAFSLWLEVSKLVGKHAVEKIILGDYHEPKMENRIFLFIDLTDSTRLSQKLGNEKFSYLIKDFFDDIDKAVQRFGGEIYQYAGDQVIAHWPATESHNFDASVESFLVFHNMIKGKRGRYLDRYGVVPGFKAALHEGSVMVSWVGTSKREIVYQGEVLNITSRITELAKNLGHPLLVSEAVASRTGSFAKKRLLFAGKYVLKGVELPVTIYYGLTKPKSGADCDELSDLIEDPCAHMN
ncbi:MAG TPA: adenylate/guanylate cyclase domain-containing protein [Flavisolibacter sp.]|nr:adenylate/guanylate cyclase domain-containing protein [Flavisolibacter sp.]